MTNTNFNSDIFFGPAYQIDAKFIPSAQQEGFQIQLHQKNLNEKDVIENLYSPRLNHT